jgi:hypothetical protein
MRCESDILAHGACATTVIPAEAGIHPEHASPLRMLSMDPRLREDDVLSAARWN